MSMPIDVGATGVYSIQQATLRAEMELAEYDPELFALVHETMAYEGHVDWRR